jgi:hypothetical protein
LIEINQSPINIEERPTKPLTKKEEEPSRIMKVSDKVERKKGANATSPPNEIKNISVISRRDQNSSAIGSCLDEHRASQVQ